MLSDESKGGLQYKKLSSPQTPEYYWGNSLLFPTLPSPGDAALWLTIFSEEFPGASHRCLAWDIAPTPGSPGLSNEVIKEFQALGLRHSCTWVLSTQAIQAPRHINPDIRVRKVTTDSQWEEVAKLLTLCRASEHEEAHYRAFVDGLLANLRPRVSAGQGHWYASYLGPQLVSSLGLFKSGPLARFQMVCTHPAYRQRGFAGTTLYYAGQEFLSTGCKDLLILADAGESAKDLYLSLGFTHTESLEGFAYFPNQLRPGAS